MHLERRRDNYVAGCWLMSPKTMRFDIDIERLLYICTVLASSAGLEGHAANSIYKKVAVYICNESPPNIVQLMCPQSYGSLWKATSFVDSIGDLAGIWTVLWWERQ